MPLPDRIDDMETGVRYRTAYALAADALERFAYRDPTIAEVDALKARLLAELVAGDPSMGEELCVEAIRDAIEKRRPRW